MADQQKARRLAPRRLRKLADHLEQSRALDKFDFTVVCRAILGKRASSTCGYAGCAIGELPACFPKHFDWKDGLFGERSVVLIENPRHYDGSGASKFFGLNGDESSALFLPELQYSVSPPLPRLGPNATPKAVARNLRLYAERIEAEFKKGK